MRFIPLALAALAASPSMAYPGMDDTVNEIKKLAARKDGHEHSTQLLGDLRTLKDRQLTSSGRNIKRILQGRGDPESNERYRNVPRRDSAACKRDTCCIWKYISDELQDLFRGNSGRCTKWARFAIRMGFHDAGTWSLETESEGGGADGSIILAGELSRVENKGIQEMGVKYEQVYKKYHDDLGFDIGMADLIQMGSNIACVVCPLGPRVRSWVGRIDSNKPSQRGLLPNVRSDADTLIKLFQDKTIGPEDLVALLGAHTTSQQNFVDETRAGDPQDSTPGVWDVLYYRETLGKVKTPKRVFMFPSDLALAQHPLTRPEFLKFGNGNSGAQSHWDEVSL